MMMMMQSPKHTNNDGERVRLSRAKSSIIEQRRDSNDRSTDQSNRIKLTNNQQHRQQHRRYETMIDSRSDLTPLQDIYSSDPSTTIDLSIANTVIEQQLLQQNDGDAIDDNNNANKTKRFSAEIFEKLNITPESYPLETNRVIGSEMDSNGDLWEAALAISDKSLTSKVVDNSIALNE
ncbi:hypothetical protein BLA29_012331, partial [Euroglyphus maynei]